MSFSSSVKTELADLGVERDCCLKAETYGLLLFSRSFTASEMLLQTENRAVAQRWYHFVKKVCAVKPVLQESKAGVCHLSIPSPSDRIKALETFGHSAQETSLHVNRANLEDECCMQAFVRGAFLSCASMTDPNKEYHLEFLMPRRRLSGDFVSILNELQIPSSQTLRKGVGVIYLKGSEHIEDLLTNIGAMSSTLQLMNIKIYKDMRNVINRRANCETANITRTVEAALAQAEDIAFLSEIGEFEKLPARLREVAILRRDNPELSLSELGKLATPQLSRSGVNHRLTKLSELAAELRKKHSKTKG